MVAQDQSSMRFENCCHTSVGRCLMSSNSIPMTSHHEILGLSVLGHMVVFSRRKKLGNRDSLIM